jgi:hypothetical protein
MAFFSKTNVITKSVHNLAFLSKKSQFFAEFFGENFFKNNTIWQPWCALSQALHVDEHQVSQENKLVRELELLKDELAPLEERRKSLAEQVRAEDGP